MYRELKADAIIRTAEVLVARVGERFPGSSLSKVAVEILGVSRATAETSRRIGRPIWPLRGAAWALIAVMIGGLAVLGPLLPLTRHEGSLEDVLQGIDSGMNIVVLLGGGIFFVVSLERRIKRRRALAALHELRSLAHIIDMHQLSKDPERHLMRGADTQSSPTRVLTPFELGRYLDYCSEMLSMVGKVAAIYAQHFEDQVALTAVDEVEDLTTSLSRKIWQKMMILNAAPRERNA